MFTTIRRPPRRRTQRRPAAVRPRLELLEDRLAPAVITVTTSADTIAVDGLATLREAITSINNQTDVNGDITLNRVGNYASQPGGTADTIAFNIPGSGVKTISPAAAEPTIVRPLTINGYTQGAASANTLANGDNAVILIQLDGSSAGAGVDGLTLASGSGGSTIKGLDITNFPGNGIVVGSSGNSILGTFIGVSPAGAAQQSAGGDGIRIASASNNLIGTPNPADRNIVSSGLDGIHVAGTIAAPATGNLIQGNFVGTNLDGKSRPLTGPLSRPTSITRGADGNLWFTEFSNNAIGRMTPAGVVTEFRLILLFGDSGPLDIVSDPTNNLLYFTEANFGRIGSINPLAGSSAAIFASEKQSAVVYSGAGAGVSGIMLGPDGNLWFTETNANRVCSTPPDFSSMSEFPTGISAGAAPTNIVTGSDGALWFAEKNNNAIARITTTATVTEFSLAALGAGTGPSDIVLDPANNFLYFTQGNTGRIGRINTLAGSDAAILASESQSAVVPSGAGAGITGITFGPDSNLWFTESAVAHIGNANPTLTTINEFSNGITPGANPHDIATGADGALWFTEVDRTAVGRITTAGSVTSEYNLPGSASNTLAGIEISGGTANTVGGTAAGARNVIGFNTAGIVIDNGGQGNVIQGNFCGVGADGVTPVSNQQQGIVLRSSNGLAAPFGPAQPNEPAVSFNQIGGAAAGAGNLVDFNGTAGIAVFGNPVSASGQANVSNAILGNSLFENGRINSTIELGIDLSNQFPFPSDDGTTANDSRGHNGPADPNGLQNFPVLFAAAPDSGKTAITGMLQSAANSTYRIEFFANDPDPGGGIAEAQQLLGSASVSTNIFGRAAINVTLNVAAASGRVITATATDGAGDTSELSAPVSILTQDEHFVHAVYQAALGRAGSLAELDGWVAVLHGSGGSTAAVAAAIGRSVEARDFLVKGWYVSYLGRPAGGGEEQSWVDSLLAGQTEEQLLADFLASAEFYNRAQALFAGATADQRFVQGLYQDLLGRAASSAEAAAWANLIPQRGRHGVILDIESSIEYRSLVFGGLYQNLLHRQADLSGLAGWVFSNSDVFSVRVGFEGSSEFYVDG